MKRKKIKRILISTMATAMLATLTFGVASLSVKAETTPNYFKATGGSYTMTDPNVAYTKADGSTGAGSSGVKIHVTPTTAGEDVKLTLQGAHKRYVGTGWWGGSLRYRMDDTNASAVIATYRSNIDQEYAISFIMTSAGTYVSLTDDVVFENGVPYMAGSTVPMDIDLANTKKVADSNHALIDFRPTVSHKQAPGVAYSTNEMFKEVNNAFSPFSLTDAAIVEDEKVAASEAYAYRYTQEWIEQMLSDLSFNDSILELTFVDVAAQGTILSLLELNGYNYAAVAKSGWNSDPMTAFQAPKPLVVQKTASMKFDGTNIATNLNDYWEVWDYSVDGGKKNLSVFKSINTYKNKNYDYTAQGGVFAGSTASTALLSNNYHVLRPGLIGGPTAYYYMYLNDTTNYPSYFYGRFDLMSKLNVSVSGSTKVIYVPAWTDFTLADYEWDNCPISATGAIAGSASKTYGTNDAINVKDYIGQTLTLTLGDHTEESIPGYPATTTTPGLTDGKYCSVCGRVLSLGEEIPVLTTDNNFWAEGGTVKLTDPSLAYTKADGSQGAASSGVKIHVTPVADGGDVKLTLKGAHQRYIGSSWWGGSLRYRMDDTNASAVIATYRSNIDQEYAISFIMTAKGTYVSLTDDIEFKNGAPYISGSNIAMSVDLLNTKMLANNNTYALLDFRPTTSRAVNAAYSTNEMFKEVNNAFSSFSLTDASIVAAEKAAVSEEYAYRYTQEWIEQLLYDLSYNDSILELTFVDVAEQGTILNLLELNGYNYAEVAKAGWNSEPMDTFQAPRPLIVQKTTEMHMSASNQAMELDTYWEVWDVASENGKASMPQRITVSGTNYDTTINTYTDKYSTQKATTSGLNKLLSGGYNAFRPGLMQQSLVYYRLVPLASHSSSQYTPVYGRINVMSNLNVTVNGVKETVWVPVCTNFTLADYEWDGCPISATGAIAGAASKTYGTKDAITVKDYFGQSLTVTLGEHNQVQVGGVAATCTEEGLTAATVCSQCDKLFQKSTVIPATGHNEVDGTAKEPTLIEAGHTAGTYCSNCDMPMVAQEVVPARVDQADFRTLDVASARIDTVSGLRFTTYIEKTIYDELINAGHTLTFYTEITTINSSKKVTIEIDNEKIFEQDGYYCFNSVLGTILPQNYTRVFFADSYMVIDGDVKTVKALTVAEREGRSYAQIITAALNDISDTETETATHYWDGMWHGLSKSAYTQAQGISTAIKAETVSPIIIYDSSVESYKAEIVAWFEDASFKVGDKVNFADLINSISLPSNETLDIMGEGSNGIVTDRGLNLKIATKAKGEIIDNGNSEYVIVYGSDVTPYHATELQYEMSNSMATAYAMPYQIDNGMTDKTKVISIGNTAYATKAGITSPEAVGITKEDGFIIKSFGDNYIIYGGSSEGNLYGVYEFLRQIFGMEFLSQTAQKFYPANEFVYAEAIDFVSNPDFDTRDYYGHIVSQGYASTGAVFGFNSPIVKADGRITNTTNESGKYTTYGGKYFRYYYGTADADIAYGSQVATTSTNSVVGHTIAEMLAADAAKSQGFTYGDKVDIGGGNMWMKGWEQINPSWYAYDPGYTSRIAARNNNATDLQITLGSVPNQVMNYDNQWNQSYYGRAVMEICWTNGLTLENGNYVYKAGSADATGSVIEKLISLCMEMIRDPKNSEAVYLELGFYDWYVECQCATCVAAYKKFGGQEYSYSYNRVTGENTLFGQHLSYKKETVNAKTYWGGFGGVVANAVNEIAKACKAQMANDPSLKDRDVKFVTLGYQRAIKAPTNLTLDEDVCVRICWRNCASHPINAANSVCTHNQQQLAAVEAWNAIAGEILIWDYTINFVDYLYYIPNYDAIKANYQYYKSIGVTQVLTQSAPWDWNFYESVLHQYVASKLMWNTELDVDTIINDFDSMYFGEYASVVANYRSIMDTMYETQNIHANTWGALDFENSSKFDVSVLNNAIAALRPSIEALEARLQYDENGEVVKNQDYYYYSRLLSVIITPQYMLIDLGLVEGNARTAMLSELKENTAFIGLIRTRESGETFADMV